MTGVEDLELTFTAEEFEFGREKRVALVEGGEDIAVTTDNVEKYVNLLRDFKTVESIRQQSQSFLEGLFEIVPAYLLHVFNEYQISLLIAGVPTIDAADWQANTTYTGYQASDDAIVWFWEIVHEYSQDQLACLLQFATGTSQVPSGGFSNLRGHDGVSRFVIQKVDQVNSLPTSGTW
jgi:hypothetical protein